MTTLADLPTPALLVDVDRLERNISGMAARFAGTGIGLRPHVKTSKCWPVASRQLAAGAIGFTCSTPAEVAWLQDMGVTDLVWAHVPIGPRKVEFAVSAAALGGLTVSLDSEDAARPLSRAAAEAGVTVPYVLEVNTGHGRLGVEPDAAVASAARIAALPGLRLRGVLTHEGHIAASPDRPALENAGRAAGALLAQTADALRRSGHEIEVVSVGSTPGAGSTPFAGGITEARPGTYVYYDANQTRLGSCTLEDCALSVLARVASVARPGRESVGGARLRQNPAPPALPRAITDAGIKAMSSDTIAAAGSVGIACDLSGAPLPELSFAEGNEEHGFLLGAGAGRLRVGDLVRLVPNHACGTTNMWSHVYAVRGEDVVDDWPISARY